MDIPWQKLDLGSMDELPDMRLLKPLNTGKRTRKTVWKERRRLSNSPKSIQKRVLKRM